MQSKTAEIDWYDRRDELEPDQVFETHDDSIVMLDRRVPGDGSAWYVAELHGGSWSYMDSKIEPGDLRTKLERDPSVG